MRHPIDSCVKPHFPTTKPMKSLQQSGVPEGLPKSRQYHLCTFDYVVVIHFVCHFREQSNMPVTTRAAALRSKTNGNEIASVKQTTPPQALGGTVRQHHSQKQQQTQVEEQLSPNCTDSESCVTSPQQSTVFQAASVIDVDSHRDQADGEQKIDMDVSLESLFCDQEVILSTAEIGENIYPMSSSVLCNQDDDEVHHDDLNATTNTPVVKEDITLGTSTRGGKTIFMNLYGYIHMNETNETISWRCVKRNENCNYISDRLRKIRGVYKALRSIFTTIPTEYMHMRRKLLLAYALPHSCWLFSTWFYYTEKQRRTIGHAFCPGLRLTYALRGWDDTTTMIVCKEKSLLDYLLSY